MKNLFISYIFPMILIFMLAVCAFIFNRITNVNFDYSKLKIESKEPKAILYNATLYQYNNDGNLSYKAHIKKVEQQKKGKYLFFDTNVLKYKDRKLKYTISSPHIVFLTDEKKFLFNQNNNLNKKMNPKINNRVKVTIYDKNN